jgi:hypothetical protein
VGSYTLSYTSTITSTSAFAPSLLMKWGEPNRERSEPRAYGSGGSGLKEVIVLVDWDDVFRDVANFSSRVASGGRLLRQLAHWTDLLRAFEAWPRIEVEWHSFCSAVRALLEEHDS